jgi:hypothetical protein
MWDFAHAARVGGKAYGSRENNKGKQGCGCYAAAIDHDGVAFGVVGVAMKTHGAAIVTTAWASTPA